MHSVRTSADPYAEAANTAVRPGTSYQFSSYDKKLISLCEVVVAYFVGLCYNDIYAVARASLTRSSGGKSLTDAYKERIQAFVIGTKNDESCYRDLITNLHKYFAAYYTMVSFPQFVDRVMSQIIPAEYFVQLSNTERDEFLSSTVCDLVSGLASFVTTPDMLQRIIDAHDANWKVTQRMIQDHGVTVMLAKRETLHNQFLRKIGQARDQVPMGLVNDMKKVLRRLVREKTEERARAERLAKELRAVRERESKYQKIIALMKAGGSGAAGASAALQAQLMPRPDRLAEADADPLDRGHRRDAPREDTLAENGRHAGSRDKDRHGDRHRSSRRRSPSPSSQSGTDSEDDDESASETGTEESEDDDRARDSRRGKRDRDRDRDRGRDRDRDHRSRHDKHRSHRDEPKDADIGSFVKPASSSSIVIKASPSSGGAALDRDVSAATSAIADVARDRAAAAGSSGDSSGDAFGANGDDDGEPITLLSATRTR